MGARGTLRVYLGAAPGVGKTYAMLGEGHRRAERGRDVVVGFVETHGREHTAEQLGDLEIIPRRVLWHRGARFEEMDVDAVLARKPSVALVDELAHTNVPGSRNHKRHQDVEELLAAGIDVITTVNVQHLESVNDVVEKITGVAQRETVPDAVVRAADQIELKDMTAEALRRRLAHGNVYAPDKVDAALANYFRAGNLTALRELALLWTADRVDEALQRYRDAHDITGTWEARERVVVALAGGPEGETLIRRGARVAARSSGGDLLAVHVARSDGLAGVAPGALAEQRRLVESLGGSYHQVLGEDVPRALLEFARAENATQLVLGARPRPVLARLLSAGSSATVIRHSGDIDVHIVTHNRRDNGTTLLPLGVVRGAATRRALRGYLLVAVLLPAVTAVLVPASGDINLGSDMLLYVFVTVLAALIGGFGPAVLSAILASGLINWFFTPPLHTLTVQDPNNLISLVVFGLVAVLVSWVVDLAARRTRQAARAAAEARVLANLAGTVVVGRNALQEMLDRVRETFGLASATLLQRQSGGEWTPLASAGPVVCEGNVIPAGRLASTGPAAEHPATELRLVLGGRELPAEDQRLARAFAAQLAVVQDRLQLGLAAAESRALAETNRVRTALLAAVGHDLRTPLATVKAAISSLLSPDVRLDERDQRELLTGADSSLDRLTRLVDNLLDMSRLQAGAFAITLTPADPDEVLTQALAGLGADGLRVQLGVEEEVPMVMTDPVLLERVLANLLANALRFSPPDTPPLLTRSRLGDRLELRVVDRGPGIPPGQWQQMFQPFQRLGDTDNSTGVGLGLALARGLAEAMRGSLEPEETPGGGLTMVVSVPVADQPQIAPGLRERAGESR